MKYYFTFNLFQSWYLQDNLKVVRIVNEQQAHKSSLTTRSRIAYSYQTKIKVGVSMNSSYIILSYLHI